MRRLQLVLLLILLGLVAAEWLDWSNEYQHAMQLPTPADQSKHENGVSAIDPQSVEDNEYYSEVARRTLFREDRRGYQGEKIAQGAVVSSPKIPDIRLIGVILTGTEKPMAVIQDEKQKKSLSLQVGDSLGEWLIEAIAEDSITLSWQGQTAKVELRKY